VGLVTWLTKSYKPRGKDSGIPFTGSKISAYIPQFKSPEIPYPLIACPVEPMNNDEADLFEWSCLFHPYEYYDLTLDAEKIMARDHKGRSVANSAFSKVKYWECPP
jgi:hypothetical protein